MTPFLFAPSRVTDESFVVSWAEFERRAVSPGGMRKILAMIEDTDARNVLPSVHVPTLVIRRTGDRTCRIEGGRYLAEHIPGARRVELAGADHFPWVGDTDSILREVERFVSGKEHVVEPDRVLATVLFTDIVDSTRQLAERGKRSWRELLTRF